MRISANNIKIGNVLNYKNKLWVVQKTQHVKPGKGGAFMQTEMKSIKEGTKLNERFRSEEDVDRVILDEIDFQFLYKDGDMFHFMNVQTYEQIELDKDIVADCAMYLKDGMIVKITYYENELISVTPPDQVSFKIVESDPVVKGQTATSSYKNAILENGMKVQVPPHIETGTEIFISTADGEYLSKA